MFAPVSVLSVRRRGNTKGFSIAQTSSEESTTTTSTSSHPIASAISSACTSSKTSQHTPFDPGQPSSPALGVSNPQFHGLTRSLSKAQLFKQQLLHQASHIGSKIRRNKSKVQSQGSEVPFLSSPIRPGSCDRSPHNTPASVLPTLNLPSPLSLLPRASTLSPSDFTPLQKSIREKQSACLKQGYLHRSSPTQHTFVKMATAEPPVSYSRLQQITIDVRRVELHMPLC